MRTGSDPAASSPAPQGGGAASGSGEADWTRQLSHWLALARTANDEFKYDRAILHLRAAQEIWNANGLPSFHLELRLELHSQMGRALASLGRHDEALAEYQTLLRHCDDSSHLEVRADTFMQVGGLLSKTGDYDRALGYLQRALGACRRLDDHVRTCKALRNLGVVYVELGEFVEAQATYHEAIEVARRAGNGIVLADLMNNLGTIMNMRGHRQEALKLYQDALEIYASATEKRKAAYCENNIGITCSEQGRLEEASEFFTRAYRTAAEIHDTSLLIISSLNLGDLLLRTNSTIEARRYADVALTQLELTGARNSHLVEGLKISAKIDLAEGRFTEAGARLTQALELARSLKLQFHEAEVLLERGQLFTSLGFNLEALGDLEASYRLYTQIQAEGRQKETGSVIQSIEFLYLKTFKLIAVDVEQKDPYTKGHSDRVASYALLLAKQLGLQAQELKTVVAAALLHDAGKIKIADSILKKEGRLTEEEYAMIKRHPALGVEMLKGKEFPWNVKPLILSHHERMDGRGYPSGLAGDAIPPGARILAIVDTFDALTSDRVYRKAFSPDKALSIMTEEAGRAFDPAIFNVFAGMVKDGQLDFIVNASTGDDELYSIWSRCMDSHTLPWSEGAPAQDSPIPTSV